MNRTKGVLYVSKVLLKVLDLKNNEHKFMSKVLLLYAKCVYRFVTGKRLGHRDTPVNYRPYPKQFSLNEEVDDSTRGATTLSHDYWCKENRRQ